ncbi:hypothetical protein KIN20_000347 [Parelaphostrongylus tenuis]|uniref:Uncharacterized protein n=1 Tax=Parelaphostrongylus tenuis TaxID=148309 RepID=A0AAD5QFI2_PARTN|nr:hypothetical protein KIN20_000347 [Parelaphostrongylus tenuis]
MGACSLTTDPICRANLKKYLCLQHLAVIDVASLATHSTGAAIDRTERCGEEALRKNNCH